MEKTGNAPGIFKIYHINRHTFMRRDITKWWSPRLNKNMEIVAYGHYGFALLMFPTAAADFLEYERFYLIDAIKPLIEAGKVKVYSINSINSESWLNSKMKARDKAIRHQQYNGYITEEVVPFIHNDCNGKVPIITTGASLGAFHSVNTALRRPDLFDGFIAMSGTYDLKWYTDGYFDDNVYFNSPVDYMPHLNDQNTLNVMRSKRHYHFVTGQGPYEHPASSKKMGSILQSKGIPCEVDLWGHDMRHDWPTWRLMLPNYLQTRF
jgi:esterase/lipase superfamily enzyme